MRLSEVKRSGHLGADSESFNSLAADSQATDSRSGDDDDGDGGRIDVSDWSRDAWRDTGWLAPDQRDYLLALHRVDGIGPRRLCAALSCLGTPSRVWHAPEPALGQIPGFTPHVVGALLAARRAIDPGDQAERLTAGGVAATAIADIAYPDRLRHIADPPLLLFHKGPLPDWSRVVAVVGTRHSTEYGETQARRFGRDLAAAGVLVLSGMARGIDTAAHDGALNAGGRTVAVLGCSPDLVYPPQNRHIYDRILTSGMPLVSEYPPGTPPLAWRFPARNRLVAAIAHAVVVVEAPEKSGALITATHASDFGTEVMVVAGPADSPRFAGSHKLLRDGASFVRHAADALADLGWLEAQIDPASGTTGQLALPLAAAAAGAFSPIEVAILRELSGVGDRPDNLASRLGLPVSEVLSALTGLLLKGLVSRQAGSTYLRHS